jgi:MFS family permease
VPDLVVPVESERLTGRVNHEYRPAAVDPLLSTRRCRPGAQAGDQQRAVYGRSVLRSLVLPVYLPCFFINGGTAMLVPLLPLYLDDVGLSDSALGLVIAAAGVGGMASQVGWGRLIDRLGDNAVMALSVGVIVASVAVFGVIGSAIALGALRLAGGMGSAGWILSRQTFLTRMTDPVSRGKAMALFGGTTRTAFLVGPLVAGIVAETAGFTTAFFVSAAATGAGLLPLLAWRSSGDQGNGATPASTERPSLRPHLRSLVLAGTGQVLVIAVRTGRFVVLPLIGTDVGLSASEVGLLVSIGGLADLLLFPVSGFLMDRFGRLHAIVPAFSLMGVGLMVLAVSTTGVGVTIAAIVIGVGNGLGSGTMLTLSADLAPATAPSGFLAALGTIRDAGKVAGPAAVGIITDAASLSVSAVTMGTISFVAAAVIAFGIGETLTRSFPEPAVG